MLNKKAAGSGAVLGIAVIIILIAVIYFAVGGNLGSFLGTQGSQEPSAFSVSPQSSVSMLEGKSATILVTYYNPFPEAVNANITLNSLESSIVSPQFQSKSVSMIASMPASATVNFNLSCAPSTIPQSATATYGVYISNYTQNLTTDIVTEAYGYPTPQTLLPQENTLPGFLTVGANPISIVTGGSTLPIHSMVINFGFGVGSNSGVYVGPQVAIPNGVLSSLSITIKNTEGGIEGANATINGVQYPFKANGAYLTFSFSNLNLATLDYALPLEIAANPTNSSTESTVTINMAYNYQYSISSGTLINCQ
jgi:hypothetical protein